MKFITWILGILLALGASFIAGDEISQRLERMELRHACYKMQSAKFPQINKSTELMIIYQCRSAIP